MKLTLYQVDAFASRIFEGNPAAICPLDKWLEDDLMQSIAAENNLSETAFFVPEKDGFHIRWFTPAQEVDLCGHATLASAFIIFSQLDYRQDTISFHTKSGHLSVQKIGKLLEMDFPSQPPRECEIPEHILNAFREEPLQCLKSEDYIVRFKDEATVQQAAADLLALRKLDLRGVIITAPGNDTDFVCRFFAPNLGIDEDPVTGSAYTQLTPYWVSELGKSQLTSRQISSRGGDIHCRLTGNRVHISGTAVLYMTATLQIE